MIALLNTIKQMNYSKNQLTKTSKFLSFVLRHKPEAIDLQLDDSGWTLISQLISKTDKELNLTPPLIEQIVLTNDKKRFQISEDGLRIRASQGHLLSYLKKILVAFNVTADWLIFEEGERDLPDELQLKFEAVSQMSADDQRTIQSLIDGIILKHTATQLSAAK